MTPTARTIQMMKDAGYRVARVEYWNAFAKIRVDLFGVIDLLCMAEGKPLLAIQVTTNSNYAKRMEKSYPIAQVWKSTGNQFWVVAWAKMGARGERKVWQAKMTEL